MPRPRHRYERVARKPLHWTHRRSLRRENDRPSLSVCSRRNVFFFENLGSAIRARDAARRRETPSDSSGNVLGDTHASLTPRFLYFPPRSSHTTRPQTRSLIQKKKRKNADAALRSRRRDFLVAQALAAATATHALVPADAWSALENADALPKDYAEKARAVVKALTESLEFESAGAPTASERFRKAEPAKEAVKAFIKDWAAAPAVQGERSHDDIVLAVRELSEFYKANGSRAALDKPTRDSVLEKLYDARDALPKAPPTLADRLLGL
jgi:hypothetical protein